MANFTHLTRTPPVRRKKIPHRLYNPPPQITSRGEAKTDPLSPPTPSGLTLPHIPTQTCMGETFARSLNFPKISARCRLRCFYPTYSKCDLMVSAMTDVMPFISVSSSIPAFLMPCIEPNLASRAFRRDGPMPGISSKMEASPCLDRRFR